MDNSFQRMSQHLHRGGQYAYGWTSHNKQSTWYPVDQPAEDPTEDVDCFFGVNPTNIKKSSNERAHNDDISAINCLYAEFDAKDFGELKMLGLEACKIKTMQHIEALTSTPDIIIDSGGGYHCYWLLNDPFMITDENTRQRAKTAQANWVKYVGGDKSAKDLARILRVPGTRNHKPAYPDAPVVRIIKWEQKCTNSQN